jgi:hypothetical protein
VSGLGEQGDDGHAGVTADDGDVLIRGVGTLQLGNKSGGSDDVKGGDAEEAFGVVDTPSLEDFGADWDGGVDLEVRRPLASECA